MRRERCGVSDDRSRCDVCTHVAVCGCEAHGGCRLAVGVRRGGGPVETPRRAASVSGREKPFDSALTRFRLSIRPPAHRIRYRVRLIKPKAK